MIRFLQREISTVEKVELDTWLNESPQNRTSFNLLHEKQFTAEQLADLHAIYNRKALISQRIKQRLSAAPFDEQIVARNHSNVYRLWSKIAAAVGAVILTTYFLYSTFFNPTLPTGIAQKTSTTGPLAGTTKAVLILGDNRQVILDSQATKTIQLGLGKAHLNTSEGVISYQSEGNDLKSNETNTLRTPVGGQYRLRLSDGTVIWLNAASSVRYPVAFSGDTREISVTGEVYLEVAKDKGRPFIVALPDHTQIEVLGTKFAINCYDNEPLQKTTLVEGIVRVKTHTTSTDLRSGEQIVYSHESQALVKKVNTEEATAFAKGFFYFSQSDIQSVGRQLARWYNVEVVYTYPAPAITFTGKIERSLPLEDVLEILKLNDVEFTISGNKIVM